ncbi:MAG: aminotransferase class I/II-fold pyridoxal phosphate-dependent enzyme [Candidatus Staskawiczbacteria bacterium]|jgi:cystathionine beta-lyase/cystathionine gamma-synthase
MRSPESREPEITREFDSPEELGDEVQKYREGKSADIYARNEYPELREREKEFADMLEAPDSALFNAGMAAIHTAIEAEDLKPGDVVLCGKDTYSQTKKVFASLKAKGVKTVSVDSGDMEEIEKKIKDEKPRLIILESVANAKEMQVNDTKRLVELARQANAEYAHSFSLDNLLNEYLAREEKYEDLAANPEFKKELVDKVKEFKAGNNPFVFRDTVRRIEADTDLDTKGSIRAAARMVKWLLANNREKVSLIIDNSLVSPVIHNPLKDLEGRDVEMVVVESATKHYQEGGDKITMGIAYSNDVEKIKKIKEKRTEIGTYLQPTAEEKIPEDITEKMPSTVKRHARNALELATLLSKSDKVLEVGHPNLPEHKQNELAKQIAPEGLVTLFYLRVPNAAEFIGRVKELAGDKVGVGASFGHPKTWLANLTEQDVRIAAGSENEQDFKALVDIFKKAVE